MEYGSMGEGKGREEGSVGLDGSEMAEVKATKSEGQGNLGCDRASTSPLDQGEHSSTQLGLHTSEGRRKDIPRDGTSKMRHAGSEGGAQDEGLALKGEGQGQ
jgi:hypothetical protein